MGLYELIRADNDCRAYIAEEQAGFALAGQMFIADLISRVIKQKNSSIAAESESYFDKALKNMYAISLGDDLKELVGNGKRSEP